LTLGKIYGNSKKKSNSPKEFDIRMVNAKYSRELNKELREALGCAKHYAEENSPIDYRFPPSA